MPGERGITISIAIHRVAFLDVHAIFILLNIEDLLQFDLWLDEELNQDALRKRIYIGHLLIHRQLKPRPSSAHDQHLIVFLADEAVVDFSGGDLVIMEGGVRDLSDF